MGEAAFDYWTNGVDNPYLLPILIVALIIIAGRRLLQD
jgi:hypothetical protein